MPFGESFSVYTDRKLANGNPQLLVRGVVVSVEREFLEVVAIKDEVKTALYTTTINLAAVEGSGIDYPQLLL